MVEITSHFEPTAPMAVAVLTFLLLLLGLLVWWILASPAQPVLFYDDCSWLNFRHQYVVRLLYDGKSTSFQNETTTVFVQIAHSINRVVKIPFTPEALSRVLLYKGHPCSKVFVRTSDRYRDVRGVSMFHDGVGSVLAFAVELQDIDVPNAVIATVQHPVFGQGHLLKTFPFGTETPTAIEEDVRPTRNVTLAESVYFFFASLNVAYLVDLYILQRYCKVEFCGLSLVLLFGVYGGLASFGALVVLLLPFRYFFKEYYHQATGRGCASLLRSLYLQGIFLGNQVIPYHGLFLTQLELIAGGIALGALVSYFAVHWNYKKINYEAKIFSAPIAWMLVIVVSIFCLFCLTSVALSLALYFRFIQLPPVADWSILKRRGNKQRPVTPVEMSMGHYKSDEAIRFSRLSSASGSSNTTRQQEKVDLGGFYRTLANQKHVVKSISTFMLPISPKPKPTHSPRTLSPERSNTTSSRTSPTTGSTNSLMAMYTPQIKKDRVKERPTKPGGAMINTPPTDAPLNQPSEASRASSSGENYYATMVKIAKIRSVSEYQHDAAK